MVRDRFAYSESVGGDEVTSTRYILREETLLLQKETKGLKQTQRCGEAKQGSIRSE